VDGVCFAKATVVDVGAEFDSQISGLWLVQDYWARDNRVLEEPTGDNSFSLVGEPADRPTETRTKERRAMNCIVV
jgi:hypothetical protein